MTALDAFDPDDDALVLVMPFDTTTAVAGRPAYGARRPAWVALEDKTTNDALFAHAGVACAPSEVVAAADRPALDPPWPGWTAAPGPSGRATPARASTAGACSCAA